MFYQTDPKYKNIKLGEGSGSLFDYGCYLFSLVNGLNRHGWDYTPEQFNDFLKTKKLWIGQYKNYIDVDSISAVLPEIFISFKKTEPWNDIPSLDYLLQNQFVVVCKVSATPIGGTGTHFVLLAGRDGNTAVIHDPWSNKIEKITARWSKYGNILGIRVFEIKDKPSTPSTLDSDQLNALDVLKNKFKSLPDSDPLKNGKLEGYARAIVDEHLRIPDYIAASKVLEGFVIKWAAKLETEPDLIALEKEMQGLMDTEDNHDLLVDACEKLVGHFETEEALRLAVAAFKKDIDGVSQVTEALIEENEMLSARKALDRFKSGELVWEILVRNKDWIFDIIKKIFKVRR